MMARGTRRPHMRTPRPRGRRGGGGGGGKGWGCALFLYALLAAMAVGGALLAYRWSA